MDESPEQFQLGYFSSVPRNAFPPPRTETSYGIALVLWLVPLAAGLFNFVCWAVLDSAWLKSSGKVIVFVGIVCGAFSIILGAIFLVTRLYAGARIWKEAFMPVVVLYSLLLLSALLTVACCSIAYR